MSRAMGAMMRRTLRGKVDGEQLLVDLVGILEQLDSGVTKVLTVDGEIGQPLSREDIARLSKAADVRLKLLAKVLPDLKQVEMVDTNTDGEPLQRPMSTLELAARMMRAYREAHAETPEWLT